ncbi:Glucose-repressible alcohol dehydrogenase transcriptional effector [Mortierella claussenii]|nr:Glucose-repressible alcohol dehydrogenase transcriptional effector [Mortierella claussenii]
MVASATAPMDIPPSHQNSSNSSLLSESSLDPASPLLLSSSCENAHVLARESPVDSGYESSWPSLSEAATWSPVLVQKYQLSASKPTSSDAIRGAGSVGTSLSPSSAKSPHVPFRSLDRNSKSLHGLEHAHRRNQVQDGAGHGGHKLRQGKGHRKRARAQAYQAKSMASLQGTTPLVDFGSPQMEDEDMYYGLVDPPIPLSVIPRGWLFEEDSTPSPADDILIALPRREWVYDSIGPLSMDSKSFVVMSWNVLSPRLCHASRLDPNCDPTFLDWNYRKQAILNQIAFTDADIICLQASELELKDYEEYFNPRLTRLGFRSIHAYKMNVYEMRDGCAIFYRDSRFKLLNEHVLRFNQVELDDYNVKRPTMARDTAIRFNLFHNLAIVALFENKRTKRQVQVATTHLLADPAFPDAKMLQTAILTSKLEDLKRQLNSPSLAPAVTREAISESSNGTSPESATSGGSRSHAASTNQSNAQQHIPTILAGDFNSLPDSSVVNFLKTGQVETLHFGDNDFGRFTRADSKHFYHYLGLADSYESSILPFTNSTRQFQGTIDYLLYDPCSLSLVGFLDHLEADPAWAKSSGPVATSSASLSRSSTSSLSSTKSASPSATVASLSVNTSTDMSSSDLTCEQEMDMPSSAASSASSSVGFIRSLARTSKTTSKRDTKKTSQLDFSKLFISATTQSSGSTATASLEELGSRRARAPLPTALPSQYLPSDHIPLVAIYREREYVPAPELIGA